MMLLPDEYIRNGRETSSTTDIFTRLEASLTPLTCKTFLLLHLGFASASGNNKDIAPTHSGV